MTEVLATYWPKLAKYAGDCVYCGEKTEGEFKPKDDPYVGHSAFTWKDRELGWVVAHPDCYAKRAKAKPIYWFNGRFTTAPYPRNHKRTPAIAMDCTTCWTEVAWVKSKKGKYYLAEIGPALGSVPHECIGLEEYARRKAIIDKYKDAEERHEALKKAELSEWLATPTDERGEEWMTTESDALEEREEERAAELEVLFGAAKEAEATPDEGWTNKYGLKVGDRPRPSTRSVL